MLVNSTTSTVSSVAVALESGVKVGIDVGGSDVVAFAVGAEVVTTPESKMSSCDRSSSKISSCRICFRSVFLCWRLRRRLGLLPSRGGAELSAVIADRHAAGNSNLIVS
jgi:hypothetical protein